MAELSARLPRLTGLLMFEAAARNQSFTAAARELNVTQAAVSQQVRLLERQLGLRLFARLHRGLELTPHGKQLFRAVETGFGHIANTADEMRNGDGPPTLSIGVTFAIAAFWLVPRLPSFRALHPEIDVHVLASDRGLASLAGRVDAAIAFGDGNWDGFTASLLQEADIFPVCSPGYLAERPAVHGAEQLAGEKLLSLEDDRAGLIDWPFWFASVGVKVGTLPRRVKFNSLSLLLQAACEGQGIALGWSMLADDLIDNGALIRPVEAVVRSPRSYYLAIANRKQARPETQAFRIWLLGHFGKEG